MQFSSLVRSNQFRFLVLAFLVALLGIALASSAQEKTDPVGAWRAKSDEGLQALQAGDLEKAERAYREALKVAEGFGPQDLRLATSLDNVGLVLVARENSVEAEEFFQKALQIREKALGPGHPAVAVSLEHLGDVYYRRGARLRSAINDEGLGRARVLYWPRDLEVPPVVDVKVPAWTKDWFAEARQYYTRALAIREKNKSDEDNPEMVRSLRNLGVLALMDKDYATAEAYLNRALAILEHSGHANTLETAFVLAELGSVATARKNYRGAIEMYERSMKIVEGSLGPASYGAVRISAELAEAHAAQGNYDTAEQCFERTISAVEGKRGPNEPLLAPFLRSYARVERKAGRKAKAVSLERRADNIEEQFGGHVTL